MSAYTKISILGQKGSDGLTFLVKDKRGKKYAMKTFNPRKSSKKIEQEAKLQKIASEYDICPKIKEYNLEEKFIVMEPLKYHLYRILRKNGGIVSEKDQMRLIEIFLLLDVARIFHNDINMANFMYDEDDRLYIIDFGCSKYVDDNMVKKIGKNPNFDLMTIGMILKLKEMNVPKSSYKYLKRYVTKENIKNYNL